MVEQAIGNASRSSESIATVDQSQITMPTSFNDQLREDDSHRQLKGLQERAERVASYLGFESFDILADWVSKGDALRSRLGFVQPSPQSVLSSSSAKGGLHSETVIRQKSEHQGGHSSGNDSPLVGKGKGRAKSSLSSALGGKEGNLPQEDAEALPASGDILAENEQLQSTAKSLQKKLQVLQEKYDILLQAKRKAEEKHKADHKRWNNFKEALLEDKTSLRKAETRRKSTARPLTVDISTSIVDKSSSSVLSPPSKQGALIRHRSLGSLQNDVASRSANLNCMELIFGARAVTAQDNRESLSLRNSKASEHDVFSTPNADQKLLSDDTSSTSTAVASRSKTLSASGLIRRGRYNKGHDGQIAINAEFEINREANGGVTYQFDEVVRDRSRRQRLHAGDCDCCKDYYDLVKPIPARVGLMWRSPTPVRVRRPEANVGGSTSSKRPHSSCRTHDPDFSPFVSPVHDRQVDAHRQQISRHRHVWAPPATPPDYWTIEFPDTQRAADINKRAADMHKDKRRRIEKEAISKNGRFVRRDKT